MLVLYIKGIRWHFINTFKNGKKFFVKSFYRFFESYAFGIITPGRLGEVLKLGYENNIHNKFKTSIHILAERGFDVGIFIFFALIALSSGRFLNVDFTVLLIVCLISFSLLLLSYLLLCSKLTYFYIQKLIYKLTRKSILLDSIPIKHSPQRTLIIFVLSVISNICYFLSCYFLSMSVFLHIPFLIVTGVIAIVGLINMLPITIMGLGTREYALLTLFGDYSQTNIIAFSIILFSVAQIGACIFSLINSLIFLQIDKRNNQKNG